MRPRLPDQVGKTSMLGTIVFLGTIAVVAPRPMENGQSLVGRDGVIIDCRTEHDSYFPDPDDCHYFYHCSDWAGLEHKHCGPALYFHPQKNVCDWPYIVRRVRHDCPPGDTPGHQELPLRVVDIDSKEETTPAFDDGSYIRFEPNPENKFRFPTQRPPPKTKKPLVLEALQKSTAKPQRRLPETAPRGVLPLSKSQVVLIKRKKAAELNLKEVPRISLTNRKRGPKPVVVKTLPNRDIVKSLPPSAIPSGRPVVTLTRPSGDFIRAPHRPPTPAQFRFSGGTVPPQERRLVTLIKPSPGDDLDSIFIDSSDLKFDHTVLGEEEEDEVIDPEKRKIKLLLEAAKVDHRPEIDIEDITTTVYSDEVNSNSEEDEELSTTSTTTEKVVRITTSPFKTPEERPEFLQILKKKALKLKDKLLGIENGTVSDEVELESSSSEEPRLKLTIVKVTSLTSENPVTATTTEEEQEEEDTGEAPVVTSTSLPLVTSTSPPVVTSTSPGVTSTSPGVTSTSPGVTSTSPLVVTSQSPSVVTSQRPSVVTSTSSTSVTTSLTVPAPTTTPTRTTVANLKLSDLVAATTTTSTVGTDSTTDREAEESDVDELDNTSTDEPKLVIIKPSGNGNEDDKEDDDVEAVYVVEAVSQIVPEAQPLISFDGDNAVQESRIHTTIAEVTTTPKEAEDSVDSTTLTPNDEPEESTTTEETDDEIVYEKDEGEDSHASSYDMLMTLMEHLNLNSMMLYWSGKPLPPVGIVNVEETAKEISQKKSTSPQTPPTLTSTTPASSTVTSATTDEPSVAKEEEQQQEEEEQVLEEQEQQESTATAKKTTVSTSQSSSESIQIVLPVGWTPSSSILEPTSPIPRTYATIVRTTEENVPVTTTEEPPTTTKKKYATIERTTPTTPQEEEVTPAIATKATPTKKQYIILDRSATPSSSEEESISVEDDSDDYSPFSFSRDKIRERLFGRQKSAGTNTRKLAEALAAKQKEEREQESKWRLGKDSKRDDQAGDESGLDVDEDKLAQRRKELFSSSRFRTSSSSRRAPESTRKVHPIEAIKQGQQKDVENPSESETARKIRAEILNRASSSAPRPKVAFLNSDKSKNSRFLRSQVRRPKSTASVQQEEKPQEQPQQQQQSIRCRILKGAC